MERLHDDDHLDGGAVGVGDDPLVPVDVVGVDFGHDQRDLGVHAPGRGVVHDDAARVAGDGGELLRGAAAGGEEGQVDAFEAIGSEFLAGDLVAPVVELHARRLGSGEGHQLFDGEVTLGEDAAHRSADGACRAHHCYPILLAHDPSFRHTSERRF